MHVVSPYALDGDPFHSEICVKHITRRSVRHQVIRFDKYLVSGFKPFQVQNAKLGFNTVPRLIRVPPNVAGSGSNAFRIAGLSFR
jgi:hypothetical protein